MINKEIVLTSDKESQFFPLWDLLYHSVCGICGEGLPEWRENGMSGLPCYDISCCDVTYYITPQTYQVHIAGGKND